MKWTAVYKPPRALQFPAMCLLVLVWEIGFVWEQNFRVMVAAKSVFLLINL